MLENLSDIEALEPGLYEMRIDNPTGDPDCDHDQYIVRFEPRRVEDLVFETQPEAFERVGRLSAQLRRLIRTSPARGCAPGLIRSQQSL